jgi:predicted Fe-Mo cluster-binding NifX family protein
VQREINFYAEAAMAQSNESVTAKQSGIVRVAIATSTGERVDQHFSKSPFFDIYDVAESTWTLVEHRSNTVASCGCQSGHGGVFDKVVELVADCRFVVAQRIGNGALSSLIDHGIRAAQIDDTVQNSLQTLISSGKLNRTLRKK